MDAELGKPSETLNAISDVELFILVFFGRIPAKTVAPAPMRATVMDACAQWVGRDITAMLEFKHSCSYFKRKGSIWTCLDDLEKTTFRTTRE